MRPQAVVRQKSVGHCTLASYTPAPTLERDAGRDPVKATFLT